MGIRVALALLGAFHILGGMVMIVSPDIWYVTAPGVTMTGPYNFHFIVDIGLIFVASGAGMMLSLRNGMAAFVLAGAIWPALHALFHMLLWMHHGLPMDAKIAFAETVLVAGVGLAGLALAWVHAKRNGAI